MKFDETGDLGQLGVAAEPHLLEGIFGAFLHAESVHGNEHYPSPVQADGTTCSRTGIASCKSTSLGHVNEWKIACGRSARPGSCFLGTLPSAIVPRPFQSFSPR